MPACLGDVVERFDQVCGIGPREQREGVVLPRDAVQARVEQFVRARRIDRQAGGDAERAVEHAAVRDDDDRLACVPPGEFAKRRLDALVQREQRLPASGQRECGLALAPAPVRRRVDPFDLLVGATLEAAVVPLAQPRLDAQLEAMRRRDRLGRLSRPQQVARVDRAQRPGGKPLPGLARLLDALLIERRVELPLEATFAIPGGDAVADEDELGFQASLGFSV